MTTQNTQDIFTLLTAPTYYPLQTKMGYCWPCQVKTIIETKTKEDKVERFYTTTLRERVVWGMSPFSIYKILRKYGFHAKIGFLKGQTQHKVEYIKRKLATGPVILLVFNAPKANERFAIFRALFKHHYISVRWYNDTTQEFYIYNSNPKKEVRKDIPIGNQVFTYKEIIQLGKYTGLWLVRNLYISLG